MLLFLSYDLIVPPKTDDWQAAANKIPGSLTSKPKIVKPLVFEGIYILCIDLPISLNFALGSRGRSLGGYKNQA